MCPECAKAWRLRTRRRYIAIVKTFESPRFMTLTLKKDEGNHCENVSKLWSFRNQCFRRLRDRGYKIRGWVATLELPNHLHIIMDSDYIPQGELSDIWLDITGDSFIVDVRAKDHFGRALKDNLSLCAAYVTKYVTKLTRIPYLTAVLLKGFHLIGSHVPKEVRGNRKKKPVRFVRIDRLEFEACYLDYYEPIDIGPPRTGLDAFVT